MADQEVRGPAGTEPEPEPEVARQEQRHPRNLRRHRLVRRPCDPRHHRRATRHTRAHRRPRPQARPLVAAHPAGGLTAAHPRQALPLAIWFHTESDGKWNTRYPSMTAVGAPPKMLDHEHVLTRKALVDRLVADPQNCAAASATTRSTSASSARTGITMRRPSRIQGNAPWRTSSDTKLRDRALASESDAPNAPSARRRDSPAVTRIGSVPRVLPVRATAHGPRAPQDVRAQKREPPRPRPPASAAIPTISPTPSHQPRTSCPRTTRYAVPPTNRPPEWKPLVAWA